MSWLKGLIGGGSSSSTRPNISAPPTRDVKTTIQSIRDQIDLMAKREKLLTKRIDDETNKAKQALQAKNKQTAITCMKRRKQLEQQLGNIQTQTLNLETMMSKVEEAQLNVETLSVQQQAANALHGIMRNADVDQVDKVVDNVREAMDKADEISQAISQPLGLSAELDDDELLAELDEMVADDAEREMLKVNLPASAIKPTPQVVNAPLPRVPTGPIGSAASSRAAVPQVEDEEDEFAKLEREMAGAH